jgi:hypothetical protein
VQVEHIDIETGKPRKITSSHAEFLDKDNNVVASYKVAKETITTEIEDI